MKAKITIEYNFLRVDLLNSKERVTNLYHVAYNPHQSAKQQFQKAMEQVRYDTGREIEFVTDPAYSHLIK